MITEDYVSFEIAKLLKEKGFDANLLACYTSGGLFSCSYGIKTYTNKSEDSAVECICPTFQMVMKWLREVHYYNIEIDTLGMMELNTLTWRSAVYYLVNENECYCEDGFDSYEEACEAAIKFCLENLI